MTDLEYFKAEAKKYKEQKTAIAQSQQPIATRQQPVNDTKKVA